MNLSVSYKDEQAKVAFLPSLLFLSSMISSSLMPLCFVRASAVNDFSTGIPTSVTGVIRVSQFRFLLAAHRLDASLSLHSFRSRTESLSVHKLHWFMHSRISSASAIEVKPQP